MVQQTMEGNILYKLITKTIPQRYATDISDIMNISILLISSDFSLHQFDKAKHDLWNADNQCWVQTEA